jgi:hypothetical protein
VCQKNPENNLRNRILLARFNDRTLKTINPRDTTTQERHNSSENFWAHDNGHKRVIQGKRDVHEFVIVYFADNREQYQFSQLRVMRVMHLN